MRAFAFYFDAFRELSTCRTSGMELGPIPFTAINEYSTLYGVTDFEEFRTIIRIMDDCFMKGMASKKDAK